MRITKIKLYQVEVPLKTPLIMCHGRHFNQYKTNLVEVETDANIKGYGEIFPAGPNYLPAFSEGVLAGLRVLAPSLIGLNPLEIHTVYREMDSQLKGHPYVKAPIDMAMWDILGKHSGLPLHTLWGGKCGGGIPLMQCVSLLPPTDIVPIVQDFRKQGYKTFNIKLGEDAHTDILRLQAARGALGPECKVIGDANTAWLPVDAVKVLDGVRDLDVHIEQPCATYEECAMVRRHTNKPLGLDEIVTDINLVLKAYQDGTLNYLNLKINKFGGPTKTKQIRDLCVSLGIAMVITDAWGTEFTLAAVAHMAQSTPAKYRISSTHLVSNNKISLGTGCPEAHDGSLEASDKPGLGIEPIFEAMGEPVYSYP